MNPIRVGAGAAAAAFAIVPVASNHGNASEIPRPRSTVRLDNLVCIFDIAIRPILGK